MFSVVVFIVGMIFGGSFGVIATVLAVAAKDRDEWIFYKEDQEQNEYIYIYVYKVTKKTEKNTHACEL